MSSLAMARTRPKSKRRRHAALTPTLARALAPEEICPGDDVVVLYEVCELPSYMWCGDAALLPRDEVVRIRITPTTEPLPLRVRAVCLPFVLVRQPCGRQHTLDVRRCRLARLNRGFAIAAAKAYKRKSSRQQCERT
jgi:hypothetical protein